VSDLHRALLTAFVAVCVLASGCTPAPDAGADVTPTPLTALPEPPPEPPPPRSFTMNVVGDIMLDRTVGARIEANGAASIFEKVRDELRSADVTFANLECPLSTVGPHSPREHLLFRADPRTVDVLLDGGIDIVALANNHSLNAGVEGLQQTIDHLETAGVAYCGAARERESSWQPTLFDVQDVLIGFVACTDLSFQHGSWCKVDSEMTEFRKRIAAAKERCEVLVVSIHWGNEYQNVPSGRQRDVAHAAVEAGADLVIGHHPHVLQGIGQHEGAPILYSCGNFVFDQREGERMESAIFHLQFTEGEGWEITATPVWIPLSCCGPIYPESARAAKIAGRIAELSANLGVSGTVLDNKVRAEIPLEDGARKQATVSDDQPAVAQSG